MTERTRLRIVFMGTPQFAVASLKKLFEAGYHIVGVVTAPDKPAGRGMKVQISDVKKYAVENGLKVFQPAKLKDSQFIEDLKALNADLQVVVAFRMLPEIVWNMPPLGTINLHGSLLPQYRGAAPINWAIINGEKETGVTTFKLQHEIDTGNILLQQPVPILITDNAETIHDKLMETGADLMLETVRKLECGDVTPIDQSTIATEKDLKHAPKIFPDMCEVNWNNATKKVYDFIRGLSPYPGAYTFLSGKRVKLYETEMEFSEHQHPAGEIFSDHKTFLKFATTDGFVHIKRLKPEGKKEMRISDFLRGWRP